MRQAFLKCSCRYSLFLSSDIPTRILIVLQSAARVSTGQRDRILKLRQAHLLKIEGIVRKRKDIVWELQQATVMPESASSRQTAFSKVIVFPNLSLNVHS